MSEQEKKSSNTVAGGSSVLVVDHQTSGTRQKQSYRSSELQEEPPEIHHKRSRAPAVPSVNEELKDICVDSDVSTDTDIKEQPTEQERAEPYDKQKQLLAKNLSSNNKKYDTPEHTEYETITLAPMKVETKLDTVVPPQPIPSSILEKESSASHVPEKSTVKKVDEDSIKDEIAELRTPETVKKLSDWSDDDEEEAGGLPSVETRGSRVSRKNVPRKSDRRQYFLEKKASVGPCYRPTTPLERPSGITICLPKKSSRNINVRSGISIAIPKKRPSKSTIKIEMRKRENKKASDYQSGSDGE